MKASCCACHGAQKDASIFAKKRSATNVKPVDKLLFICCPCEAKSIVSLWESGSAPGAVCVTADSHA